MPIDANTRAVSLLSAIGLLFTAIVLCYLETTTSAFLWSTTLLIAIGITALAMCSKLASALGVENKLAEYADKVMSVIPWLAVLTNGYQVLHYKDDGMSGFMAGIALIGLVVIVAFGLADSIASIIGSKFQAAQGAMHEMSERAHAIREAASGGRRS